MLSPRVIVSAVVLSLAPVLAIAAAPQNIVCSSDSGDDFEARLRKATQTEAIYAGNPHQNLRVVCSRPSIDNGSTVCDYWDTTAWSTVTCDPL